MKSELAPAIAGYHKELRVFEELLASAVRVSDVSGGIHTSDLGIEATKVYTRITLTAMTLGSILPMNRANRTQLWDFPSVASLARTFLETCHRHLYLCEEDLSDEQAAFRLMLFFYHMRSEKYRLYKEFGAGPETLSEFEAKLPIAKQELMASPAFQALPPHMAEKVKRGNTGMHMTDEAIAEKYSLIGGRYKPIYRLLSNHAHGTPFATYSQSNERGRGITNLAEVHYIDLAVTLLNHYLSTSVTNQIRLLNLKDKLKRDLAYATTVRDSGR